jgi:membrane associated rhomboid family serine protease
MIELTKGVKNILIANVICFVLTYIMFTFKIPGLEYFVLYSSKSEYFQSHQLLTYMFLHGSLLHIVFNMIGLILFGPDIEKRFGTSKFVKAYLSMGVVSGLFNMLLMSNPVLGASGAIWGLMVLYALFNPNNILYIYFIIPTKVKYIIVLFFSVELYLSIMGSNDGVSHLAHVGGALTGLLIYLINQKYFLIRNKKF